MLLTNIHNLPDGIFQAVINSIQQPQDGIIRVSELINPPIIKKLALENWETLEADASEFLWSLLGSGVHAVLAKQDSDVLIERRVTVDVCGIELSGQIDRYNKSTQTIEDYKCTSVWSYLFGVKPEWVAQLNLYKYLFETTGYEVKKLTINAILRDWQISKAMQADYPKIPFAMIDIPLWSADKINDYIKERVDIHQALALLPCNEDERWQRDSTFAIMKEGRKSAVRVLDTWKEAEDYFDNKIKNNDKPKCKIVERIGEAVKCKSYCLVRHICKYNFYKVEQLDKEFNKLFGKGNK